MKAEKPKHLYKPFAESDVLFLRVKVTLLCIMNQKMRRMKLMITLTNGPGLEDDVQYDYRKYQDIYWVLIDGEWVPIDDPEWRPGQPLPDDLSEDEVVSVQGDYGSLSYSYDPVGNRLSQNNLTYTYSDMNELLSITDGTTFTYDGMGNTLTRSDDTDTWSYTYDTRNQLTQIEKNQQVIAQYSYSGGGKRIQKTEWVEDLQEYHTTIYIYSGLQVIYEKNLTTDQEATYIYGSTGRIAKKVNGLANFYHTDHLGSTRLVTTESGTTATAVAYKSFGEDAVTGKKNSYTYNGKEKDSAGLYYYGARYYDPGTGRFISRDFSSGRMTNPQTLNRYAYCLNNPLRYRDPDGLEAAGALVGEGGGYPSLGFEGDPVSFSWAPQKIAEAVSPGNPLCLILMLFALAGMFGICYPVELVSAISGLGSKAAAAISNVLHQIAAALETLYGAWEGLSLTTKIEIISILLTIATWIVVTQREIDEPTDAYQKTLYDDNNNLLGFMVILDTKHGYERGLVTLFNGPGPEDDIQYEYRKYQDIYWVLIDGEWVPIDDPEWRPGQPLPDDLSGDDVKT